MPQRISPEEMAKSLSARISEANEFFDGERIPTIQIIAWVVGETQEELSHALNDTYILLQKTSSGHIVFPSGSIEGHEIDKGCLSPQSIILAGLREFKEELHAILTIDADQIIDAYPPLPFETPKGKYVQFKLVVAISPLKVNDLEKRFQETLKHMALDQQEHNHCYIKSYDQIRQGMQSNHLTLKETTELSLEFHRIRKTSGKYGISHL